MVVPSLSVKLPVIRNSNHPVCANCVHFIRSNVSPPADQHQSDNIYGKCKAFGTMDVISGSIAYDYASLCRDNDKQCGLNAIHYQDKAKE
jgi:hypothetical protein